MAAADWPRASRRRHGRGSSERRRYCAEHGATLTLREECRDGNVAAIAAKYEGREGQLFAKLRDMYDVDSDEEGGADGEAADEWEPRRVAQAPLLGEGRVVCADGGGQHSVVLVEAA